MTDLIMNKGMWFQFAPDKNGRSQLFYGFPTVPWGPPNLARIAVDAASRRIKDPSERLTNVVNPEDIRDAQDFIRQNVVGVDSTVPAFTLSCLQTNVFGAHSTMPLHKDLICSPSANWNVKQTTCSFSTLSQNSISMAVPKTAW